MIVVDIGGIGECYCHPVHCFSAARDPTVIGVDNSHVHEVINGNKDGYPLRFFPYALFDREFGHWVRLRAT